MKEYMFTAPSFEGSVSFFYNAEGLLTGFQLEGSVLRKQHTWLLSKLPLTESQLGIFRVIKNANVREVKRDITFEIFYERYPVKRNKKRAQTTFARLSRADRLKAFNYITYYQKSLKPGVELKYPDTYLRNEPWND